MRREKDDCVIQEDKKSGSKDRGFFDKISDAGLIFSEAIKDYLEGDTEQFKWRIKEIKQHERDVDNLRHDIKYNLYPKMLIPESRATYSDFLRHQTMSSIRQRPFWRTPI